MRIIKITGIPGGGIPDRIYMTKKDFEVIAQIVAIIGRGDISRVENRADWLNNKLTSINPKFDKAKFWDAVEKYRRGIID